MADLLVGSQATNQVMKYDAVTGQFISIVIRPGAGGAALRRPRGIKIGADGKIYVASMDNSRVLRYNADGSFDSVFASAGGLMNPDGIVFDSTGKLLVCDWANNNVLRYNADGTFDRVFASGNGLTTPEGLTFGSDNKLYICSSGVGSHQVLRFNADGTFDRVFTTGIALSSGPRDIAFHPTSGDLHVTSSGTIGGEFGATGVFRFDGTTGAFIDLFAGAALNTAFGLLFGNSLLAANPFDHSVFEFAFLSGQFSRNFASGGGLHTPGYLAFMSSVS